jgi:hypothetical protein
MMKKKQFEYGVYGLLIGLVLGALIGFAELNWIKKSQRHVVAVPMMIVTAIIVSIGGYGIGNKNGKRIYIEEKLGIDKASHEYCREGRYWIGRTTWKDHRQERPYRIETKRIDGNLCSCFNGQVFRYHGIPNANQQTVPRYHKETVQDVFNRLFDGYVEDGEQILEL